MAAFFCVHWFLIGVWLQNGLLSRIDWFGVKVALSIHRNRLFHSGTNGGIHIVWRQSSSYGTETRHGHLEQLGVVLLHEERRKATGINVKLHLLL